MNPSVRSTSAERNVGLTLDDVERIAADVARAMRPTLDVVGVTGSEEAYAEVLLTIRGCQEEPCRVLLGVNRESSESDCRHDIEARLRQHLIEHREST